MYLHKLKIGNVELENNILLAPMAGVTDLAFRKICKEYGNPGLVYTEMASSRAVFHNDEKTKKLLDEASGDLKEAHVESVSEIAKVSAVGIGMKSHSGVAATFFGALARAGINVELITTSEIKIAVGIDLKRADEAVNLLHSAFDLDDKTQD